MKKRFIYFHNNLWKGLVWRLEEEWCNGLGPPPFMRENSTSSDLSNSTYKSLTNRYQYRFVSDFMNLSTCFRYIIGSTSVYSK